MGDELMRLLLIGYNDSALTSLDTVLPKGSVTVLEEPDVWAGRGLAAKAARHACLGTVEFETYQQDDGYLRALKLIGTIDAVAPGLEYAVEAAAGSAEALGLPGAGVAAAATLRSKLRLREAMANAGMNCPRFTQVHGPKDIEAFADGAACVVKPAERQASLGVVLLDPGDDAEAAWAECTGAAEGARLADRPMRWNYLVEERMVGPEVSTEVLVADGAIRFLNVTAKETLPGRHPVEVGHSVPGDDATRNQLAAAVEQLVAAVGFQTGILHAEWILQHGEPYLVECAGRPPGDHILDLIEIAYDTNITAAWISVLAGEQVELPQAATSAAAVRFVMGSSGELAHVDGVGVAQRCIGVHAVEQILAPGDVIDGSGSSWDRVACVIARGDNPGSARHHALLAASRIHVTTMTRDESPGTAPTSETAANGVGR
jgi:biotin carboxylase